MNLLPDQNLLSATQGETGGNHVVAFADDFADEAKGARADNSKDFILFGGRVVGIHGIGLALWLWKMVMVVIGGI